MLRNIDRRKAKVVQVIIPIDLAHKLVEAPDNQYYSVIHEVGKCVISALKNQNNFVMIDETRKKAHCPRCQSSNTRVKRLSFTGGADFRLMCDDCKLIWESRYELGLPDGQDFQAHPK